MHSWRLVASGDCQGSSAGPCPRLACCAHARLASPWVMIRCSGSATSAVRPEVSGVLAGRWQAAWTSRLPVSAFHVRSATVPSSS